MIDKTLAAKSQAHTRYTVDGVPVPGVTTVLGVLAKPALIGWANRMGLAGIDTSKYVDAAARAGTACHAMIEAHLKGTEFPKDSYDKDTLTLAENGYRKYIAWEAGNKVENVESELSLVSKRGFGGTVDMYCLLNGSPTLVDFKTNASGIYPEMMHQVVAYKMLLEESGRPVSQVIIIRVGKSVEDDLETRFIGNWGAHEEMFMACLKIYNLQKRLKG